MVSLEEDMPVTPWETLVERYCPEGKRVCNCGQAYETFLPAGESGIYKGGVPVAGWRCMHGCGANQIAARDIVARGVLANVVIVTAPVTEVKGGIYRGDGK